MGQNYNKSVSYIGVYLGGMIFFFKIMYAIKYLICANLI